MTPLCLGCARGARSRSVVMLQGWADPRVRLRSMTHRLLTPHRRRVWLSKPTWSHCRGAIKGPISVRKPMGADTAPPGRSVPVRRRAWAWVALAEFAGLVVAVAAVVVLSGDSLIALVFTAMVCLLLGGAALWWAFTTRKMWKRWLNLVLVVLVVVTLVINLVAFSLWQAAGMLAIVVAALAYWAGRPAGAHRRRAGRPRAAPGHAAGPTVAAGQSPLRRWHRRPGRPRGRRPRPRYQRA
jgi:hypothetical protein